MHRIFTTSVASVYPHYVAKVEKKGRTQAELHEVITWLTGYDETQLERHLAASSVPTLFLHGDTPVRERERMVRDFQDGVAPVFLLSLKAGGTGLNLTRADHVIHFDRWWNPAVEDQATDRAHRLGQTRAVQVHRLLTEGTIEQRIGQLLDRKRDLAESVLGTGEVALTELSNEELRDLVTLRTSGDVSA